jgi:ribose transport system substrate-binding protein
LTRSSPKRLYLIPVLSKALDILELLQNEHGPLSLETIYQRTNISKTTVGFGGESTDMPFSEAVADSLKEAAAAAGVDVMVLDNRYDGPTAVRNADEFVARRVDLVIEFQIDQRVAPVIADKIDEARIPLIAVDIPHPHAVFFGVNNYRVGFEAGEFLAQHATVKWNGKVCWALGLDIEEAGPLVQSRVTGAFEAIRSALPDMSGERLMRLDGRGMREKSYRLVLDFLRRHPKDRGILIAAATDTSALGAVQAVREARREKHVAIVGQDCIPEALEEMKRKDSPLIGSVSHEAQTYGPRLIHLGLAILGGQQVPPYNYVEHKLVTALQARQAGQA